LIEHIQRGLDPRQIINDAKAMEAEVIRSEEDAQHPSSACLVIFCSGVLLESRGFQM
jgi:hypothetical protein